MRRRTRVILGGLLLLLLAMVLVPALVPADKWKDMVLERIEAETDLQVEASSAALSFPWPLGLKLSELSVRDPRGVTSMEHLKADIREALVYVELGPLLRGRVEAREIGLEAVDVEWATGDGVIHRIEGMRARASATAVAESAQVELTELELLDLHGQGQLHWDSAAKRMQFDLDLKADVAQAVAHLAEAQLLRDEDLENSNLRSLEGQASAQFVGRLDVGEDGDWQFEAHLSEGEMQGFRYVLPADGGKVKGAPEWIASVESDRERAQTPQPVAVSYEIQAKGIEFTPPEWTEPLRATGGSAQGDLQELRLLALRFEGAGIEGGAAELRTADLQGEPHTTGDVSAASMDVGRWQAAAGLEKEARETWRLEGLVGQCDVLGDRLKVEGARAQTADGAVEGDFDLDFGTDPPTWKARANGGAFVAESLLSPVAPALAGALRAMLTGDLEFTGAMTPDPAQSLGSLRGAAHLVCNEGALSTTPILGDRLAEFLGSNAEQWRELEFSDLQAALRVVDGRVFFDRVFLRGETEVALSGSVGLDGSNDYRLDIRLPEGVAPRLGALTPLADLLKDDEGRFAFAAKVGGRASQPQVEIDFADLEARAKEAGEENVKDRLGDVLEGLGSKLLGGKKQ